MAVLLFEDKLGITDGYQSAWQSLCIANGLNPQAFTRFSLWRIAALARHVDKLLIRKGNRKSPGFNPATADIVREVFTKAVAAVNPEAILVMDVALLGLFEPDWGSATIDNMRGGVYDWQGIPVLITVPISAIHTQKKTKDIAMLNDGATSQDEWEEGEHEEGEFFMEPYVIPYGRFVLVSDLMKLSRILSRRGFT